MRCEEVRQLLSPYLDSELDDRTIFLIGRHLDDCPECATRFKQEQDLELAVTQRLRRADGDESAVLQNVLKKALARRGRRFGPSVTSAVAAVVVFVGLAAAYIYLNGAKDGSLNRSSMNRGVGAIPDLIAAAAADHRKSVNGQLAPEVSGAEAEAWLRARLGIEVRFPLLPGGWSVVGVRLCRLRTAKVGLIMLRYRSTVVSLFVVPEEEAKKFPSTGVVASGTQQYEVPGGYGIVTRTDSGMVCCAIGDLAPENLEGLLASAR